ncbi:hypothetical protein GA516_16815 [Lactobacillus pentosus]|uniref:hypothetical protein n=1 Tax=Lactiplantibacillus pentosus TaxID=1589 RepID=UPI00128CCF14|nr:hypothetical protein [Lactiplantibacillus pentosus]MCT3294292.1 hypothetical protein [Lactiplantibacillus pentosus]MPQ20896.1 hypothetical protein [Lactiplantibacillus pentosus]UXI96193.1 hypothetical protein N5A89_09325 [Lactiplantibacillus pentosus]
MENTVGYLKFSDFKGETTTHFDYLKMGMLYFAPTSTFANDELEEAQIAREGSLDAFTTKDWETYTRFNGTGAETPHGISGL